MFRSTPGSSMSASQTVDRRSRIASPSAAYTLSVQEQVVDCQDGTYTVTLPPVTEAAGNFYSIYAPNGVSGTITLADQSDSRDWQGPYSLAAADDFILLYSDGMRWCVLENHIT